MTRHRPKLSMSKNGRKKYKVMFVCPTNKLLQAFEGEALTINEFFGISFGDVKLAPCDYSYFDVIVFDEIYFSSLSTYWRIKQFLELNKDSKKRQVIQSN